MDEDSSSKPLSPSDRLRQQFERKAKDKQKLVDERGRKFLMRVATRFPSALRRTALTRI